MEWVSRENPDIICFQETKAKPEQCSPEIWEKLGYHSFHHSAEKAGYSSVATMTKTIPKQVKIGMDHLFFDKEGRSVGISLGSFYLWNVYFPSGTSGDERQAKKMEFLSFIQNYSQNLLKEHKNIILCGDVNIAHEEIDIHNPKGNQKNSGFLPEERQWVSDFLSLGWIDAFRYIHPQEKKYSWWSYRFQARSQNKGWRIDYFFLSKSMQKKIIASSIHTEMIFSDHAPISIELEK
jgi:exodeoxyribonuclease-3